MIYMIYNDTITRPRGRVRGPAGGGVNGGGIFSIGNGGFSVMVSLSLY